MNYQELRNQARGAEGGGYTGYKNILYAMKSLVVIAESQEPAVKVSSTPSLHYYIRFWRH